MYTTYLPIATKPSTATGHGAAVVRGQESMYKCMFSACVGELQGLALSCGSVFPRIMCKWQEEGGVQRLLTFRLCDPGRRACNA